jgi:hypothetical protein
MADTYTQFNDTFLSFGQGTVIIVPATVFNGSSHGFLATGTSGQEEGSKKDCNPAVWPEKIEFGRKIIHLVLS